MARGPRVHAAAPRLRRPPSTTRPRPRARKGPIVTRAPSDPMGSPVGPRERRASKPRTGLRPTRRSTRRPRRTHCARVSARGPTDLSVAPRPRSERLTPLTRRPTLDSCERERNCHLLAPYDRRGRPQVDRDLRVFAKAWAQTRIVRQIGKRIALRRPRRAQERRGADRKPRYPPSNRHRAPSARLRRGARPQRPSTHQMGAPKYANREMASAGAAPSGPGVPWTARQSRGDARARRVDMSGSGAWSSTSTRFRSAPELFPSRSRVRGLYVAGGSTHPGPGVQGVSGDGAARALLTDLRVRRPSDS